jgi:hypothetical protein
MAVRKSKGFSLEIAEAWTLASSIITKQINQLSFRCSLLRTVMV